MPCQPSECWLFNDDQFGDLGIAVGQPKLVEVDAVFQLFHAPFPLAFLPSRSPWCVGTAKARATPKMGLSAKAKNTRQPKRCTENWCKPEGITDTKHPDF